MALRMLHFLSHDSETSTRLVACQEVHQGETSPGIVQPDRRAGRAALSALPSTRPASRSRFFAARPPENPRLPRPDPAPGQLPPPSPVFMHVAEGLGGTRPEQFQ